MKTLVLIILISVPIIVHGQAPGDYMETLYTIETNKSINHSSEFSYSMTYRFYANNVKELYHPKPRKRLYKYINQQNVEVIDIKIYKRRNVFLVNYSMKHLPMNH